MSGSNVVKAPLISGALIFNSERYSMKQGHFYFISDEFFQKYDPDHRLMQNKEDGHFRPCFYAITDKDNPLIFWCIPISSKVDKYKAIVQKKIEYQMEKGVSHPQCDTIRFGEVMGYQRAFLIQNMFPVTQDYINSVYIDRNTQQPVTVSSLLEKDIQKKAHKVLNLVKRGNKRLVFSDIMQTKQQLIVEIQNNPLRDFLLSSSKDKPFNKEATLSKETEWER